MMLMVAANVFGVETMIDGIMYEVITKAKEAKVIKYRFDLPYKGDIVIPETIDYEGVTCRVTSIEEQSFYYCANLTSVTIPGSVTSIGVSAFQGCKGLSSLTIPSSVTSIGIAAFRECSGLTSMTIPDGMTSIQSETFYLCSGLTSVTIPESVTDIGMQAFYECSRLASVTIPSSVTQISNLLFYGCSGLTSVTFQGSVTSIGGGAFQNCSSLTQVTIPVSVTSIGDGAFKNCTAVHISDLEAWCNIEFVDNPLCYAHHLFLNGEEIKELVIPSGLKSIANYAFYGCSALTSVSIPGSVTTIGRSAFLGCNNLESVHITDLEAWCKTSFKDNHSNPLVYAHHIFLNGEEIEELVVPSSVRSIGELAFADCSGLTSIRLANGVETIGNYAFANCSGLTSITMGKGLKKIGNNAFANCSSLASVSMGKGLKKIGNNAFIGCRGLTTVVIPDSVTSIGNSAFMNCSGLSTITIGDGMKTIDSKAFARCPELTDVYCYAENVSTVDENGFITCSDAFEGSYIEYATLHVPTASIDAYKATAPWSDFKNIVELDGSIVEEENALYLDDVEAVQGTDVMLSVKLFNTMDIEGFAFDLILPAGFNLVKDEDGKPIVSLSDKRTTTACINSFTVVMLNNDVSDGVRVIAASTNGSAISAGDGEVCTVLVGMENGLKGGIYNVVLRNISIADTEALSHELKNVTSTIIVKAFDPGDANCDGKVTVADLTAIAHHVLGNTPKSFSTTAADANQDGDVNVADFTAVAHLLLYGSIERPTTARLFAPDVTDVSSIDNTVYIEPLSAMAGEELTLSVRMRNSVEAEGLQFTLCLPEGVCVVLNADGLPNAFLSTERTTPERTNTFVAALRAENKLTVMAASTNGSAFSGSDGEVCQVRISTAPDMAVGDYALLLSDVCISDTHARSHSVEQLTTSLTISEASANANIVAAGTQETVYYDLQGRRLDGTPTRSGLYIQDGRKVVVR